MATNALTRTLPQAFDQFRVVQQEAHCRRHSRHIVFIHPNARFTLDDRFRNAGMPRRDDGQPGSAGLENADR